MSRHISEKMADVGLRWRAPYRHKCDVEDYAPPDGYRMVYQGGHHNVYCDGVSHIKTVGGGTTGLTVAGYGRTLACDCASYV